MKRILHMRLGLCLCMFLALGVLFTGRAGAYFSTGSAEKYARLTATKAVLSAVFDESRRGMVDHIYRGVYDAEWELADRVYFEDLIANRAEDFTRIYEEYRHLYNVKSSYEELAYEGESGYFIFDPQQTEAVFVLANAITAREDALISIYNYGYATDDHNYYPEERYYKATKAIFGEDTELYETDSFGYFDLDTIIFSIERLNLDDYFLYGTKFYFIKGVLNKDIAAYNNNSYTRAFFDSNIVFFDTAMGVRQLSSTVAHEIGHSISCEIFYTYAEENYFGYEENEEVKREFAEIYGEKVPKADVDWEDDFYENFCEEYSRIHTGAVKMSRWQGGSKEKKMAEVFIRSKLNAVNIEDVPLVQDVRILSATINAGMPDLIYTEGTVITPEGLLVIDLRGLVNRENRPLMLEVREYYGWTISAVYDVPPDGIVYLKMPEGYRYLRVGINNGGYSDIIQLVSLYNYSFSQT